MSGTSRRGDKDRRFGVVTYVDLKTKKKLEALSKWTGRSIEELARQSITELLARQTNALKQGKRRLMAQLMDEDY